MKTQTLASFLLVLAALVLLPVSLRAQAAPKTANIVQDVASDGSIALAVEMSFDAAAWRQWKSQVGDDPSRLRAMMKHQFSALVIDDFKLEKDDLNRTAKLTMRSPAGPELRKDGRFRIAIEKEFRLVNNNGREWFFSGNNPLANNSLQTIRIVMPANAVGVTLVGPGNTDQGLIYSVKVPAGKSRAFVISGAVLALMGAGALAAGLLSRKGSAPTPRAAAA